MSRVTIGKIIARPEDRRRNQVWDALEPLRWRGREAGAFSLGLPHGVSLRIELGSRDVTVLQQVDGLLDRMARDNREVAAAVTGSDDPDRLRDLAWFALAPVRSQGYGNGEYSVKFAGPRVFRFVVDRWEAMLLRRLDVLLGRLYDENSDVWEQELEMNGVDQEWRPARAAA